MKNQPGQKRIALFFFEMFTTGFKKSYHEIRTKSRILLVWPNRSDQ